MPKSTYEAQRYARLFNLIKGGMSVSDATERLRTERTENGVPFQISDALARRIGREAIAARTPLQTAPTEKPELIPSVYHGYRPIRYVGTAYYEIRDLRTGELLRSEERNVAAYSNREVSAGIARERLIDSAIRQLMDV